MEDTHRIKILLITGHFPPERSGGTGRPYSLYKYLPGNNIDVVVITKNVYGTLPDENNIYRYDSLWNWRRSGIFSTIFFSKIITFLKNGLYGINYDKWWQQQVIQSEKDYNKESIDIIYATFPGVEVLETALVLKHKLKVPLIVEFRDGLAFESGVPSPNLLQKVVINKLEKNIISHADVIVTIGKNLSDYFIKKYNREVHTVYNGYEESDFTTSLTNKSERTNKKNLIHFGSLNASRKALRVGLFEALARLKDAQVINQNNLSVQFIGNISAKEKKRIAAYDLKDIITFLPSMDKSAGFSFIRKHADYLLFYGIRNAKTIISSKIPEYLKLDKPIIGICKGNEAAEIIKRTGTGEVCDFESNSIETLLLKMLHNEIYYQPDKEQIDTFNRKYQAKEIALIIKNVVSSSKINS